MIEPTPNPRALRGGARWVLIRPVHPSRYYDPEVQEPLGLQCLSASLRSAGHHVLVLDGALLGLDSIRLARRAAAFEPDVVGLSLMTAEAVAPAREIAREMGRTMPGRHLSWVAGGHFVSTEPEMASRLLPPEMRIVIHEGERTILDLAELALGSTDEAPQERIMTGRPAEDLDSLPDPERPFAGELVRRGQALNLQGSRGCSGACHFCASPALRPLGVAQWRARSPQRIAAEMADLSRAHGARVFNFVDEDFLGPAAQAEARALAVSRAIRDRSLAVTFGIQARPHTMTERAATALVGAGLRHVFMGIESDDPGDLVRWGRASGYDAWSTTEMLRRLRVDVHAGVMLFHPMATLPGIRRFAGRLRDSGLLSYRTAISCLVAVPGSFFARAARQKGVIGADRTGPRLLPFVKPEVASFYDRLRHVLAPIGPAAMHAICAMPDLHGRAELDAEAGARCRSLRGLLARIDEQVSSAFFSLLDAQEQGRVAAELALGLRANMRRAALIAAEEMVAMALLPNVEALLRAMEIDAPDTGPEPSAVGEVGIG